MQDNGDRIDKIYRIGILLCEKMIRESEGLGFWCAY